MLQIKFPRFGVAGAPYQDGDPVGFYVAKGGWKGWDDLPSSRGEKVTRPFAHGDFDLPVFRVPRVLSITGLAIAESRFDLGRMRSLVTGTGADGDLVPVSVEHQEEVLTSTGRVLGATFTDQGYRGRRQVARFSLDLECRDPRKYGASRTFSGASMTVHHYGNFPAAPVLEIAGARAAPYTVTGPGGRLVRVTQALAAGQTHRIDFATGGLFRNGARQLGGISHYQPWTIPPGAQVPISISAGQLTVRVTDTYM